MLKNYALIALRNLMRNKAYSAINIFGLALGVACCLLLTLYILDEIGFDRHHKQAENLYRIVTEFTSDNDFGKLGTASPPIAMTMKDEIPEVESAVRIVSTTSQNLIRYQDNLFYETDGYVADSTLFEVFTYDLKQGNPQTALTHTNSVVLSEKLAKKTFWQ